MLQAITDNLIPAWTGGGSDGHRLAFAYQSLE